LRDAMSKMHLCDCENYTGTELNDDNKSVCDRCGGIANDNDMSKSAYDLKHSEPYLSTHPNVKSSPKEILGHHAHKPHGTSVLWPALYEHLREKGMSKGKAATISNGLWRKKHGMPPKSVPGSKGKLGTDVLPDVRKMNMSNDDNYGRHGYTAYELRKSLRNSVLKGEPTSGDSHVDGPMPDFPIPKLKRTKRQANPADSDTVAKGFFAPPGGPKAPRDADGDGMVASKPGGPEDTRKAPVARPQARGVASKPVARTKTRGVASRPIGRVKLEEDEVPYTTRTGAKIVDYDGTGAGSATYSDGSTFDEKGFSQRAARSGYRGGRGKNRTNDETNSERTAENKRQKAAVGRFQANRRAGRQIGAKSEKEDLRSIDRRESETDDQRETRELRERGFDATGKDLPGPAGRKSSRQGTTYGNGASPFGVKKAEPRDADGDGMVNDGKPTQRPAKPKVPKVKTLKPTVAKPNKPVLKVPLSSNAIRSLLKEELVGTTAGVTQRNSYTVKGMGRYLDNGVRVRLYNGKLSPWDAVIEAGGANGQTALARNLKQIKSKLEAAGYEINEVNYINVRVNNPKTKRTEWGISKTRIESIYVQEKS